MVTQTVLDQFQQIYTSSNPQRIDDCLQFIPCCLLEEANEYLCRPVTNEEIKKASFFLGSLKAHGGDGLNGLFFQNHWEDMGLDICEAIQAFF